MTTSTLTNELRKLQVKQLTGNEPTNVVGIELKVLREQGILIDLNVSGVGMFQKTLTWLETGINDQAGDRRAEQFTKGMKLLYPEPEVRKLKSVESRMRQLIGKYAFSITGFYPYHWLPFTAYETFREKWDELAAEFRYVKRDMVSNHDDYVDDMTEQYREIAEAAWKSLTQGRKMLKLTRRGASVTLDHDGFVDSFVETTVTQIPSAEFIDERLQASYVTALVYGSADFAADSAAASLIRERSAAEIERTRLENRRLNQQLQGEARSRQLDQREREIKIQAMRDAEMENARKQLEQLASPFQEVFSAIRQRFAEDANALLESIQKNGYVRGKVAERGRGLIELFDLLAIHDDGELRNALVSLKGLLGPTSTEERRDTEAIRAVLNQIADMADGEVQRLTTGPTKFSIVDID